MAKDIDFELLAKRAEQAKYWQTPAPLVLSDDDIEIIDEALEMLSSYVVADISSAEECLDDAYDIAARTWKTRNVDLSNDADAQIIETVFNDGKAKSDYIEKLRERIKRK